MYAEPEPAQLDCMEFGVDQVQTLLTEAVTDLLFVFLITCNGISNPAVFTQLHC